MADQLKKMIYDREKIIIHHREIIYDGQKMAHDRKKMIYDGPKIIHDEKKMIYDRREMVHDAVLVGFWVVMRLFRGVTKEAGMVSTGFFVVMR